jgi:hypothetical protein
MNYSSLRRSPRVNLRDEVPLRYPLAIYVEPTNKCNFKCIFCPESFEDYPEISGGFSQLNLDQWHLIATEISSLTNGNGVKTLNFYMMGEPFINKSLLSFVSDAKERGLSDRIIITSNGSLINSRIHKDLIASGLDYLRISIYGATEADQKENTQTNISISKIRDNLRGLFEMRNGMGSKKPYIYLKMIDQLSPLRNNEFLEGFVDLADEVAIEPRMDWNSPEGANLAGVSRDDLVSSAYHKNTKSACPFPFYTLVIHADLQVSVCCVDWSKSLVIGSLKSNSLAEIWLGEKLRAIQLAHLNGLRNSIDACKNCLYLYTVSGNLDGLAGNEFEARSAT